MVLQMRQYIFLMYKCIHYKGVIFVCVCVQKNYTNEQTYYRHFILYLFGKLFFKVHYLCYNFFIWNFNLFFCLSDKNVKIRFFSSLVSLNSLKIIWTSSVNVTIWINQSEKFPFKEGNDILRLRHTPKRLFTWKIIVQLMIPKII